MLLPWGNAVVVDVPPNDPSCCGEGEIPRLFSEFKISEKAKLEGL